MNQEMCENFINHLLLLSNNTKAMAEIRRATPDSYYDAAKYIFYKLPDDQMTFRNRCCFTVAALFAWHQGHSEHDSFGCNLRPLLNSPSTEKRVVCLLKADTDNALFFHLRQILRLLKNEPINFANLLYLLVNWKHPKMWAQDRIANDFFRGRKIIETNVDDVTEIDDESSDDDIDDEDE